MHTDYNYFMTTGISCRHLAFPATGSRDGRELAPQ